MKTLLIGIMLSVITISVFAQADSIPPTTIDTIRQEDEIREIDTYADKFIPRRASLYAAILPGAGQIYNKKYWKLPFVYGGFIALGLTIDFYNDLYTDYRSQLFQLLDDPSFIPPSGASESQLRTAIDDARRERDFWMVMTGVFYLLQIAEAHIDAHLKEFQLNPNLRVSMKPMVEQNLMFGGYQSGVTLTIRLDP